MCDIVLSSTRWPSTKPPLDAVNVGNDECVAWPHPPGHLGGAGHEMKEEMKIGRLAVSPSADSPWRTSYRQMKFAWRSITGYRDSNRTRSVFFLVTTVLKVSGWPSVPA